MYYIYLNLRKKVKKILKINLFAIVFFYPYAIIIKQTMRNKKHRLKQQNKKFFEIWIAEAI